MPSSGLDCLHVAKFKGERRIQNVIYELKPADERLYFYAPKKGGIIEAEYLGDKNEEAFARAFSTAARSLDER